MSTSLCDEPFQKKGPWNVWSEYIQFTKKKVFETTKGLNNWSTQLNELN